MAAPCRYLGLVSIKLRSNEMNQVHELWEVILQKHDDNNLTIVNNHVENRECMFEI
jgi:hypothetical protein